MSSAPATGQTDKHVDDVALVNKALGGDAAAMRALVDRITPIVHVRVGRALYRRASDARGRVVRQEVEDLTQEVFVTFFAAKGKVLRAWDPQRGLSLFNFVGLVAEREVASILRSGKRSPWTEDPTMHDTLDRMGGAATDPEPVIASRQVLQVLLDELRARLSPLGLRLFHLLYVQQRSVKEVGDETGMSADALYAWRSRLRKVVHEIRREVISENSASARRPQRGHS